MRASAGSPAQKCHLRACKRFAAWLKRSPDTATADEMRLFQLHLAETGVGICTRNDTMTGLQVPVPRHAAPARSGGRDLSHQGAAEGSADPQCRTRRSGFWRWPAALRDRLLLSLGYGAGLRAGEVVRLKVKHIDSAQMIIRVEQSKGRKDRLVMLSPEMLDLLREWWKARPKGRDAGMPVQERLLFPRLARQAGR